MLYFTILDRVITALDCITNPCMYCRLLKMCAYKIYTRNVDQAPNVSPLMFSEDTQYLFCPSGEWNQCQLRLDQSMTNYLPRLQCPTKETHIFVWFCKDLLLISHLYFISNKSICLINVLNTSKSNIQQWDKEILTCNNIEYFLSFL